MSQIESILKKLNGTRECEILTATEKAYQKINSAQTEWYENSGWACPSGCGTCCHGFEPDALECEALYMAAWLLENQHENALAVSQNIFPFDNSSLDNAPGKKTCVFFNQDSPYHCSIYGGRAFICRLFGGSAFRSKNGEAVWKPCKFFPDAALKARALEHRQYSEEEVRQKLGSVPPVMSDLMEEALSISPGNNRTALLSEILPGAIRRLLFLISLNC